MNLFTSVYRPLIESQELRKKLKMWLCLAVHRMNSRGKEALGQSFTSVERPCNSSRVQTLRLYTASNVTTCIIRVTLYCTFMSRKTISHYACLFLEGFTTHIHSRDHIGPKIHSRVQTTWGITVVRSTRWYE